ncbi:alpha-ribazole-5'-phosphate phosphatase [Neobacillus massiliamazoniensis]|uniref:Alpha-ribazole-5'-phosphate phosphatase n=2 Tax=Neobacillus massiliamazoniensis TaxID=1499688 RepID=A0A0U1NSG2_9BACI|nr:alpha-ribazole-5'-phosphate phosphatase [Neobacillus massiliamazoniensis]
MDDGVVIALFRHCLTMENKRKAYLGWNDSPLCPESFELSPVGGYDQLFSSDLQRCISTAKILFPDFSPFPLKELREMNFGKWEGKTYEDLKGEQLYQQWLSDPEKYSPPEGESFQQFTKRAKNGWRKITSEILSQNIQRCAIVTHGGIIRFLLSEFAPEQKPFWFWQIKHDIGFELIFTRESLRGGKRCTLLQEVPLTASGLG